MTLTFPPGARADDALLTTGLSRRIARALTCKVGFDDHYGVVFPSDYESLLNVTSAGRRLSADTDYARSRKVLLSVPRSLGDGLATLTRWRVPPNMTFTAPHARCLGAVHDALITAPRVVDAPPDEIALAKSWVEVSAEAGSEYGMGGV